MNKKTSFIFLGIALCVVLGALLIVSQSCRSDQAVTDQPNSLGIAAADTSPSWAPDGQKIVFVSNRDGNHEIYIMNSDGSNPTRLTNNQARDSAASWSPDGQRIVFSSHRDGNGEIYTMNPDGSNQMKLTDNIANDGGPSWSLNGKKIIFASYRDGNWEIYTMNPDGSNQTRLTDNVVGDGSPSWSPNGNRIVFVSGRDGNNEIYTMNTDGSNQTRLTENTGINAMPSWSPDGAKIAFNSNRDGNFEIYTMNADGSNQTRLTNDPARDLRPNWSPGGQKIVFDSDRDFDREVYIMNTNGSNSVNLTNNAPVNETHGLAPLPQSELSLDKIPNKIVFESFRETEGKENWEICLVDASGSDFINLTNTPEIDEMYPHASPDGRQICFVVDDGEDKESKSRNVYTMNIDGTDRVKIAENAYQPCWSANGRYIAYLPGEYTRHDPTTLANKGLVIFNLETGEKKQHPNDEIVHINRLCWSPNGKWFVAASRGPIRALKVDDKTMRTLPIPGCTPDISPDGKFLVWNGSDQSLNMGTLDFDSPQSSVILHRIVIACEREYWVYHADWSPDGNYLTFSYAPEDGGDMVGEPAPGSNICICDLRTGKWTQITTDGKHNKEPDWVPVGRH